MLGERHKIGIYCPGNGTGGPWRYVHSLVRELNRDEFDVTLFCDLVGGYEPRPDVRIVPLGGGASFAGGAADRTRGERPRRHARLSPHSMLPSGVRLLAGHVKDAFGLSRLLRRHPVDLFHTQNTGCEESPLAARLAGVPRVIGTFHVDSTYDLGHVRSGWPHRAIEHASNRCLHRAIAVSEQTKADWVRRTHLDESRVATIHNGIDPARFQRTRTRAQARAMLGLPPGDELVIGGVGRLEPAKGFGYLLEAVARLAGEFPNLRLAIAGAGPLAEELRLQAKAGGVTERVSWLGFCKDVSLVYDALDVFALPSLCEALPYALLEAMSHELPAVGATVGGVSEVIVPHVTGMLIPPRDAAALAAALRPLLASAELRTRMGGAGRERVARQFTEVECVRRTIALYRRELSALRVPRPARVGEVLA